MIAAGTRAAALRSHAISVTFGSTRALDDVSLSFEHGSVHAVLGGNGSGKSTFVKVLAGVVRAAPGGELVVDGKPTITEKWAPSSAADAGIRFVHQNPSFFTGMSVAENLDLMRTGVRRWRWRVDWTEQRRYCQEVIDRFELAMSPETSVDRLRPADRALLAIAQALAAMPRDGHGVLVLDEPTASLPRSETDVLLTHMRRYAATGQSIVFVTHRLDEVLSAADTVSVLRDGRHVGTFACEGMSEQSLAGEVMGRSVVVSHRTTSSPGPTVLELRNVSVGPVRGADLALRAGEVVGLAGLLGSGRSALLRGIFGAQPLEEGAVLVDGRPLTRGRVVEAVRAGIAYVSEDRKHQGVLTGLNVREHISMVRLSGYWRRFRFAHRSERTDTMRAMRHHRITAASSEAAIGTLSGGNQQKVLLARWLQTAPRILLLDEPTEGVDVGSRVELFELIHEAVDGGAGALIVSSDFNELCVTCDRILVLRDGELHSVPPDVARSPHELLAMASATAVPA